jgi:hypothetical protein
MQGGKGGGIGVWKAGGEVVRMVGSRFRELDSFLNDLTAAGKSCSRGRGKAFASSRAETREPAEGGWL